MSDWEAEPFTLISTLASQSLYPDFEALTSAKVADQDVQLTAALRAHYPELNITVIPASNCPLITFASLGYATAELDTNTENVVRWRGYIQASRRGGQGQLGDALFFAKYHYEWAGDDFLLYTIGSGNQTLQYVLKEPGDGEDVRSHCKKTDALMKAVATTLQGDENQFIYVFDRYWYRSKELWNEVQQASWDKVILDANMKKELAGVATNFFDSQDIYRRYGVPWKRGLIFHGPPGNGKTISLKALMHTLYARKDPIPTLYVKSAPATYNIAAVFAQARQMSPCLLVMEDIETIVTSATRSYFFNEVDGLASNDGILMVASTNYLERLDPGLAQRPSRFDRKYLFPLPNKAERTLYAAWWRQKLAISSPSTLFPSCLCPAIADLTDDFSFAYMQEAFIATLLALAREDQDNPDHGDADVGVEGDEADQSVEKDDGEDDGGGADLEKYKLYRLMKVQVKILRADMGNPPQATLPATTAPPPPPPPPPATDPSRRDARDMLSWTHPNPNPPTLLHNITSHSHLAPQFASFDYPASPHGLTPTPDAPLGDDGQGKPGSAGEASSQQMANHGVFKRRVFRETAFEWR